MSINRHNYEEYFLLYTDNELSPDERRMVELFVKENKDLQQEFDLLQDMKLDPEEQISFADKSSLYKPFTLQDDVLQPDTDQEKILLFIDNEISASEKKEVELRIEQDEKFREEFVLLNKTKLTPDLSIVHPDKPSLYRVVEKQVRVIRMTWIKIAVAAAVVLVMGLLWLNQSSNESTVTPVIARIENQVPENGDKQPGLAGSDTEEIADADNKFNTNYPDEEKARQESVQQKDAEKRNDEVRPVSIKAQANNETRRSGQESTRPANIKEDQFTIAAIDKAVQNSKIENIATPVTQQSLTVNIPESKVEKGDIIDRESVAAIKSDYATEALLSTQEDAEVTAPVDGTSRKGALRGLFRKTNRFINKVTNPDINGPSVKVASFEIALAR